MSMLGRYNRCEMTRSMQDLQGGSLGSGRMRFSRRWLGTFRLHRGCLRKVPSHRKFKRFRGLAHVDRNDRRLAASELEPALFQFALEELRVGPELFQELFAFRRREQRKGRLV